jgi:hypothetical protein
LILKGRNRRVSKFAAKLDFCTFADTLVSASDHRALTGKSSLNPLKTDLELQTQMFYSSK